MLALAEQTQQNAAFQNGLSGLGGLQQVQWPAPSTNVTVPIPQEVWAKFSNDTKLAILAELGIIANGANHVSK